MVVVTFEKAKTEAERYFRELGILDRFREITHDERISRTVLFFDNLPDGMREEVRDWLTTEFPTGGRRIDFFLRGDPQNVKLSSGQRKYVRRQMERANKEGMDASGIRLAVKTEKFKDQLKGSR